MRFFGDAVVAVAGGTSDAGGVKTGIKRLLKYMVEGGLEV